MEAKSTIYVTCPECKGTGNVMTPTPLTALTSTTSGYAFVTCGRCLGGGMIETKPIPPISIGAPSSLFFTQTPIEDELAALREENAKLREVLEEIVAMLPRNVGGHGDEFGEGWRAGFEDATDEIKAYAKRALALKEK